MDNCEHMVSKIVWGLDLRFIFSRIRGMLHDEEVYDQPQSFTPERFLSSEIGSVQPDPRSLVYGFGPRCVCRDLGHWNYLDVYCDCRRCPGENIADLYLFLVISRILALFEISCMVEEGKCHVPTLEFDPGVIA